MCINCNLFAPVKHSICDFLGIDRNRYGLVSSSMRPLEMLVAKIKHGTGIESSLETYLKEAGLYDELCDVINQDIENASIVDNTMINVVLKCYFTHDLADVSLDVIASMKERIPFDKLLSLNIKDLRDYFKEIKYHQVESIPRKVIQSWQIKEDFVIQQCEKYDIELLPEPFSDREPIRKKDYVYGA